MTEVHESAHEWREESRLAGLRGKPRSHRSEKAMDNTNYLPIFHEHEQDHLIPKGYGIDENHDGGFYPYRIDMIGGATFLVYLPDVNGLDIRKDTYEQALEHLAEIVD